LPGIYHVRLKRSKTPKENAGRVLKLLPAHYQLFAAAAALAFTGRFPSFTLGGFLAFAGVLSGGLLGRSFAGFISTGAGVSLFVSGEYHASQQTGQGGSCDQC